MTGQHDGWAGRVGSRGTQQCGEEEELTAVLLATIAYHTMHSTCSMRSGMPRHTRRAPSLSSRTTFAELTSSCPAALKAATMASFTRSPTSGSDTMATAVGPEPLMVQPYAPAARAASLTAGNPGISGPRTGSTIASLSSACRVCGWGGDGGEA